MEMEQWDDGNANDDNSYQQNNVNSIESYGDNNNNSYHQNDDQYNQYNDYNQYDNNNNNNNNHNNNNNNYNSNRYMSHRNNDNYRTNNYRRNNQYNQYNRNNQYNKYNNNNYRGRGGYNKNRYNNNNSRYGGGYNNNYRQRGRGRGRGRERGRGRGRYNDRNRHYNNNDNYYQQKRPQYQPKSQHEVKNTNDNNMQSDFNENNQINQDNDYNQNNEITQYNNTGNTSNTSNANDDYRAPSSSSRPSSRDHRFGGKKKKKGRRIIEDNLDFEVNEEEDDEEEDNNEESNTNEQSRDYNNDYNNNNYNNDDNNYNDYNDYNDNNKRKTRYVDDADAQLYERNRFASNNNNNFNKKRFNNQQSFSSRKMGQRRQNTLELENLSGRAKEMALQLKSGKYDCMICQSLIGKKGRIWHCGHCYTMFHITCIKFSISIKIILAHFRFIYIVITHTLNSKWARAREDKDAETEQRAPKPDYLITKIRCPACNFVDENFKFNQYKCFCGKVIFDHDYRSSYNFASTIPHSCGDICGKKRGADCPHTCPAECHPGPCQPCKLPSTRKSSCPCGKLKYSLLCGQVEKQPRLCQQICNKLLKCGNHRCKDKCHHGECKPCEITMEQECFCGKHKKKAKCGTGIKVKVKVLKNNDEEKKEREEFVWKYSCNKKCDKLLSCKNHRCTLICHNGSCSNCPRKIETPTICACRKTTFKDIIRTSCSDPLPICDKKCGRMLGCGKHFCKKQCHDSKCQLCMLQVKKRCRCGASEKKFKCHDYHKRLKKYLENNETAIFLGQQDYWIKCGKKCKRVKSCGKHICSEICCPGRNNRTYFEGHQCREVCNKLLECGRHRCSSYCHRGRCNPCGVTYRNGVECACGSVFVPGPFQCGTRDIPICNQTCDKVLPCGHLCAAKCHHGDCPPCNRLCSKECPHGILVHNLPCKIEHRSCGNPCGLILSCGIHKCNRSCHFGPCQKESNNNKGCGQICGLELKCGHKCLSKCHAGNCNANSCKAQITVKCKCGNTSEKQYCRGRTEYELKAVPCTENCQIAERNKRFAEALNIDTRKKNSKSGHGDGNNETNSEQKEQTKKIRIPFAASVLRRILKWMNDDKSHTTIIKQDKKILSPKFVYYIEGILSAYISDDSQDLNKFKVQYPDITTLISSKSDPIINLKPMNSEQRFIVYSLVTNYLLRYERKENSGKHGSSYLEISKTKHCRIPNELLSNALIEYQIRGNEIETLESMPPSSIIVIDDSTDISSSVIQDRLLAWTGDYRMWRNENNQLFIVFTDQNARNSAMTEMRKFNGRKATQSDSLSAASSHKKNQQKKKKLKAQQQKDSQQQQQKSRNSGSANSGWSTKGDQLKFTVNNMAKIKPKKLNIKTNNRFG